MYESRRAQHVTYGTNGERYGTDRSNRGLSKRKIICEKKNKRSGDPQRKGNSGEKIAGVIERGKKKTITPNDIYLFHNYPSRVFSCTSPFPMRRGPAPRLIIVFANVISTVIRLFGV